eukprot:312113_1
MFVFRVLVISGLAFGIPLPFTVHHPPLKPKTDVINEAFLWNGKMRYPAEVAHPITDDNVIQIERNDDQIEPDCYKFTASETGQYWTKVNCDKEVASAGGAAPVSDSTINNLIKEIPISITRVVEQPENPRLKVEKDYKFDREKRLKILEKLQSVERSETNDRLKEALKANGYYLDVAQKWLDLRASAKDDIKSDLKDWGKKVSEWKKLKDKKFGGSTKREQTERVLQNLEIEVANRIDNYAYDEFADETFSTLKQTLDEWKTEMDKAASSVDYLIDPAWKPFVFMQNQHQINQITKNLNNWDKDMSELRGLRKKRFRGDKKKEVERAENLVRLQFKAYITLNSEPIDPEKLYEWKGKVQKWRRKIKGVDVSDFADTFTTTSSEEGAFESSEGVGAAYKSSSMYGEYEGSNHYHPLINGDYNALFIGGAIGASSVVIIMLIFCLGLALGMFIYWGYSQKRALDKKRTKEAMRWIGDENCRRNEE